MPLSSELMVFRDLDIVLSEGMTWSRIEVGGQSDNTMTALFVITCL
jgi:hypothetical protein